MELLNCSSIEEFYSRVHYSDPVRYYSNLFIDKKREEYKATNKKLKFYLCSLKPLIQIYLSYKYSIKKQILGNTFYDYCKDVLNHKEEYIKLYHILADQESKDTLLNILAYKVSFDRNYLEYNFRPLQDQYLDSQLLNLSEKEVVADCGAYFGDGALAYFKYKNRAKKYYLIEPDPQNIASAKRIFSKENYENIEYCQVATSSENKEIGFDFSSGGGGSITENGVNKIQLIKIDDLIKEPLTYLKMDIEGSESDTLKGAESQIKINKPKLAVCAYHKPGDLWKLTNQVLAMRSDYKVYLRLYFSGFCEAVLYFV